MNETARIPANVDPDTGEVIDPANPRPFVAILNEQREGALADDLAAQLTEVVQAVVEHEKAGSVTLTLKVSPTDLGDSSVTIVDEVKAKVPEPPKERTLFFTDKKGALSRRNPRQMALDVPVREVPQPEVRDPKEVQ